MQKTLTAMALALTATGATAQQIEIDFAYPYSSLFDVTYERILPKFQEAYPNITVNIRATYENYEDGTNTILREAAGGDLPDVTMQGLNRQAILVERGIARSLEPFIAEEADFTTDGYNQAMLSLSTFEDQVYGLPFSVSLPVGYYNMDLMAEAGITSTDDLPSTWEEVAQVCESLIAAGVDTPMFFGWNITGNWFLQALMWSQGQPLMEGNDFMLDTPEGLAALETMDMLFDRCDMPNFSTTDGQGAFTAGDVAMMFWSTSSVGSVERSKGDFELVTNEYPGMGAAPSGLPAGGNAAMLVSDSEDPEVLAAAWAWLTFITSGEGAADVARTTGYMPPNSAANEIILADFYEANPTKATAVRQIDLLSDWQAYPGDNGLAITQVIYDGIEGIVTGDYEDMEELQEELTDEVQSLLPADS
ncbi:extracellular solute-binding protein [Pontivivens ytuae]|uniref:Extracellular solute-binding protein n=1 Tax=Pontivivens ytuae TaxID=2789856 RepID=A0A7S9LR36_9RHOB|nr:extracellular solute-binding protein [Pontivivens ytuae]QPH53652.1 extracellular solute-binding protein [Pontivivens ytuae]